MGVLRRRTKDEAGRRMQEVGRRGQTCNGGEDAMSNVH